MKSCPSSARINALQQPSGVIAAHCPSMLSTLLRTLPCLILMHLIGNTSGPLTMLRVSRLALAIGSYALFMKEQKDNPALKGLPVGKRGQMTAKLYHELSPADRADLDRRAKAMPSATRKGSVKAKVKAKSPSNTSRNANKRPPSKYIQFVKANMSKYSQLPHRDRLVAIAKLWKQQKQATK
uniref:Putative kinetoplast DNA-associated protein n=1 Tax=Trypanosoma congolense (strain IL3000) TaxID=1068625 RepID=G0UX82_TRYCI|nr:putative kinetoplast DNA-associated protein [Trypanosoma congolense IL3000]